MKLFMTAAVFVLSSSAYAADCTLHISRSACPGKEKESYSKCNGDKACDEKKKTGTEKACSTEAVKACQNKRYDVTQDKTVTAKFDGKDIEAGKDFCKDATAGLYDPAKDYPFRGKPDCK